MNTNFREFDNTPEGLEEWKADRNNGFGGSEIGALMGVNPYMSKRDVVARKIAARRGEEQSVESDAMRWGHLLESVVADEVLKVCNDLRKHTDNRTSGGWNDKQVVFYGEEPWERATPDRIVLKRRLLDWASLAVLEIKTTVINISNDGEGLVKCTIIDGGEVYIPKSWIMQVQWEMYCSGLKDAFIAVLNLQTRKMYIVGFPYDEEVVYAIKANVAECWQMVLEERLPDPITAEDLAKAYPTDNGTSVVVDDADLLQAYERLKDKRAAIKELTKGCEELENAIKGKMGDASEITAFGVRLATWKATSRNTIDTKRLQLEMPEVAERYTKTTTSRTFLIK